RRGLERMGDVPEVLPVGARGRALEGVRDAENLGDALRPPVALRRALERDQGSTQTSQQLVRFGAEHLAQLGAHLFVFVGQDGFPIASKTRCTSAPTSSNDTKVSSVPTTTEC